MRVLLVNPNREQMPWPAVPVGLCMVATAVRRAGHHVDVLDLTFSSAPAREMSAACARTRPDVVGITIRNIDNCNFEAPVFYLDEVRDDIVRVARRAAPQAKVLVGGSGVNVSGWDVLHYVEADYALVGEGEEATPRFLAALEAGDDPCSVQGILAHDGPEPITDTAAAFGHDRIFRHEPRTGRAMVADLDSTAVSEAWRWVDIRRYSRNGGPYSIQTKRGCALRCSYCVYNNIEGRKYRLRSPVSIADEIAEVVRHHGVERVDFVDSTFNLPLAHTVEICDELSRRRLSVELSTMGVNPAATSPELLTKMQRAGFATVMCTPESASDATLKSLRKGYKRDAVVRAAEQLRRANLRTFWFFMFGAPGETVETVKETLDFCERYISDDDMVLFTTGIRVYAGTPLELELKSSGWFADDDPLLMPSWFVSPEIDLEVLYRLLTDAARRHNNWMTNAETILSPRLAAFMKQGFRLLGWRGPFWQHLPKLFSWTTRFGARQRVLAANEARMRAAREIHHRRD
ncbi:MAG: radical SAM protein [Myxococcales bacterium]|nr:radical SAM protein [Myxococcales bacterium]